MASGAGAGQQVTKTCPDCRRELPIWAYSNTGARDGSLHRKRICSLCVGKRISRRAQERKRRRLQIGEWAP